MVIIRRGKILVCRMKGAPYCFLPGGHVEFGEKTEKALKREMKEETDVSVKKLCFIGTCENIFKEGVSFHHELNLVFSGILQALRISSKEPHIEFVWKNMRELKKENLLPQKLRSALVRWYKDKKSFWVSSV